MRTKKRRPGRFSVKVEIPYPDAEDRSRMLLKFFKSFSASPDSSVSKEAWDNIVRLMDGFTGDYVKEVAKQSIIRATREGRNSDSRVTFTVDDLNVAGEQVLRNYIIGKRARRHHEMIVDGGATISLSSAMIAPSDATVG